MFKAVLFALFVSSSAFGLKLHPHAETKDGVDIDVSVVSRVQQVGDPQRLWVRKGSEEKAPSEVGCGSTVQIRNGQRILISGERSCTVNLHLVSGTTLSGSCRLTSPCDSKQALSLADLTGGTTLAFACNSDIFRRRNPWSESDWADTEADDDRVLSMNVEGSDSGRVLQIRSVSRGVMCDVRVESKLEQIKSGPEPAACQNIASLATAGYKSGEEFPSEAQIHFTKSTFEKQICGGTLISSRFLLTTAHCAYNYLPQDIFVLLGCPDNKSCAGEYAQVAQNIIHPGYNSDTLENNVALLQLETENSTCVPSKALRQLVALEWERESRNSFGAESFTMQKVPLRTLCKTLCSQMHSLNEDTLCAVGSTLSTAGGFVGRPRGASGPWTVDGLVSHRMEEDSPVVAVVETAPYYVWVKKQANMDLIEFHKD